MPTSPRDPDQQGDKPHPHDPGYEKPGRGVGREDAPGQNKPKPDPDAPHPDQTLPGDLDEDEGQTPPDQSSR